MILRILVLATVLLGLNAELAAQAQQAGQGGPATFVANGTSSTLVDSRGATLYVFDRDTAGKSNCYANCAGNWPPFVGNAASKPVDNFTIVVRDDGSRQWAYKGKPLYYWHTDAKPGDKLGNNIGGVWHLVAP
jgi:predicted lipoprotein with Yx(FWY)xxD motif